MSDRRTNIICWVAAICLLAVFVARWVWIIGFGDFGLDYEFAARLLQGQRQGRDFYAIFPPLPAYVLAAALWFKDQYWVVSAHLWLWWLVHAFVAAWVGRSWGATLAQSAFVVVAVALLTVPPGTGAKSDVLIASSLAGLAVVALSRAHTRAHPGRWSFVTGVLCGICVLAKPNVGAGIALAIVSCIVALRMAHRSMPPAGGNIVALSLGVVVGFAAALAGPGYAGGYGELMRQVFAGGSEIKGGVVALILRAIPRMGTSATGVSRAVVESLLTLPVVALAAWCGFLAGRSRGQAGVRGFFPRPAHVITLVAVSVVLAVWSLYPADFPLTWTTAVARAGFVSVTFASTQLLYIGVVCGLAGFIAGDVTSRATDDDRSGARALIPIALIWTVCLAASGRYNAFFASTLFVPAFLLNAPTRWQRPVAAGVTLGLSLWTAGWQLAPNWRSTFAVLTPLPSATKFAGLSFPDHAASVPGSYPVWSSSRMIGSLAANVSPAVAGRDVLWLFAGPWPAFGGAAYTPGIHCLAANNVPPSVEQLFGDRVRAAPPSFVVTADTAEWESDRWHFLRQPILNAWLSAEYERVWTMEDNPSRIHLWRHRRGNVSSTLGDQHRR